MNSKRPADLRGHADHGWLATHHSFSFGSYYDPQNMGFRALRVINDDWIKAGSGFGTHAHENMEILTYVLDGALEHKDSMGNGSVLRPGDVQRMTAGRGVEHSEFNHSSDESLRLLQIWILPERQGLEPGYEERSFTDEQKSGRLQPIVSPDGRDGSLRVHQDVTLYASILHADETGEHRIERGRHAWLQMARGRVRANGIELGEGDGLQVSDEPSVQIEGLHASELLLFDLA
jgi:redox-sensitive bicupin YhaK (pirin superfamily)